MQKIIAAAGIASRRKAEEMIAEGLVSVNGKIVTEPGTKADPESDHIKVRGKLINLRLQQQEKIYLLLYKPTGVLTTRSDPGNRRLVIDLIGGYRDKVHPVGRLDYNTEGLLLLTNDGEFTNLIAHASKHVPKVYQVKVKGQPREQQIRQLERGVHLGAVRTAPAKITFLEESETNAWYEITLFEGRNQQIRKMFDSIGHSVLKLRRIAIGFLKNERLKPGEFRLLTPTEVKRFFKNAETPPLPPKPTAKPLAKSDAKPGRKSPVSSKPRKPLSQKSLKARKTQKPRKSGPPRRSRKGSA
ncbi:MAG: pseudouridine synthase [Blastocatellia bacterium]|nr:pseudouridine synthase [Blastocatellia bacterium]